MNIVVLAGGLSTERDVSFKSGEKIRQALERNGHHALLLDSFMGLQIDDVKDAFKDTEKYSLKVEKIPDKAPDIAKVKEQRGPYIDGFFGPNVLKLCREADIVFMALHGAEGENGKVQAAFDLFGIKYTGNGYLSSALAMDKGVTKQYLRGYGIPFPEGFTLKKENRSNFPMEIHYPCIVKPSSGGSSIGVTIVRKEEELDAAVDYAFTFEDELLIEDFIEGREFSVGVIEGHALPVIEIAPKAGFYDYKNKYEAGATVETCPADISEEKSTEMQVYAERVVAGLGLTTYARMDFMMDKNEKIFCLEANTLPGMTPTSLIPQEAEQVGLGYEDLCERIIDISLAKYA